MTSQPITMRRVLRASPERIFNALTDPAMMRQWMAPKDFDCVAAEADPRVDGSFRIVMRSPDGSIYPAAGFYSAVRPDEFLEFSWKWEPVHPLAGVETMIRITLTPQGSETLLVMEHFGLPTEEERAGHQFGWTSILEKFAQLLEGKEKQHE